MTLLKKDGIELFARMNWISLVRSINKQTNKQANKQKVIYR